MTKKQMRTLFGGAGLLTLIAGYLLIGGTHDAEAQGAPPGAPPPPVTVAQPVKREITELDNYTGRFEATDVVEIRARVGGYLQSVHFKDGDVVKKGDLLFIVDPRPYEAALKQAEAEVTAAETRVTLASSDYKRANELVKSGDVSKQVFDTRRQAQQEATANLEAAKAARDQAALNLEFTRVVAPASGRISRKLISEGNLITGGNADSTLLTTIVSLDPVYFYFDVDEQSYLKYSRMLKAGGENKRANGTPVYVALMDEKDYPHLGYLDFVDNRLDDKTGTMRGRAVFENPDMLITPGLFGRARITGSAKYDATLITDDAVVTDQSRKLVMVVGADGTVSPVPVTLGPIVDGQRVVRDGLKGDEWIVIKGLQRARPGGKVTIERGKMPEPKPELGGPGNAASNAPTAAEPQANTQSKE